MIKIKSDKIILGDSLFDGYIFIDQDKIISLSKTDDLEGELFDFTGKFVSPGFIDIHTHGAGGYDFFTSDPEQIVNGCNFLAQYGVTTVLPTVSASPFNDMAKTVKAFKKAKESGKISINAIGVHLEGPYFSKNQCGAQNPKYITPPVQEDYSKLIDNFGEYISRWSYAPELDDGSFCSYLTKNKIIASAGHTDAKYSDVSTAIDNGLNLITHLYSCTSTVTRDKGFRSLGVIESAFLRDELNVEIIADGKHLPLDLIKMIVKIKGEDKVIVVTDSLSIAGSSIKEGNMNGIEYIVEEGVCRLKDRSAFAGSVATANVLVKVLLDCGYPITTAVKMLTKNPAKLLKLNKGELKIGFDADITIFDQNLNVISTFVMGKKII